MSNLEKVREALQPLRNIRTAAAALSALTAHEQEVAELVEALKDALTVIKSASRQLTEDHKAVLSGRAWGQHSISRARAALRPFTGDEKK